MFFGHKNNIYYDKQEEKIVDFKLFEVSNFRLGSCI